MLGLTAIALPQVLGGGYGWIQEAIDGKLALNILLILIFAKMLAFSFTISSGGSGGVFAPSLFVGAMFGGALAKIFHLSDAAFVVVGMGAVFAGAARVPVAAMLMVTEMTGGYSLLVPAALAVMISYIVQENLSARFHYKSLYEAQVPYRHDSPAHKIEHVETAIRLLADKDLSVPDTISHLDLRTLMASGIPIDLPDQKQLMIGELMSNSPYVGKPVLECFPVGMDTDTELVAVFRDGHTILPQTNGLTKLQPGDRLLMIAGSQGWQQQKRHFSTNRSFSNS
jgi:CIC family chloride channel protein